ncbi:MAG: hypothetical protein K8R35_04240, partial [Bacteroidales bacterium]|nr:hypothetical protein [Bacteroidales bacterium]
MENWKIGRLEDCGIMLNNYFLFHFSTIPSFHYSVPTGDYLLKDSIMFFESAFAGKNHFWRYLVMFLAAFLAANTIGGIPLIVIISLRTAKDPSILEKATDNITDLSIYGIDPNFSLVLLIIPFIVGLLTFYLLIKPLNGRSFLTVITGGGTIRWGRFFYSALIWAALMGVYLFISVKADPGNFTINNISASL